MSDQINLQKYVTGHCERCNGGIEFDSGYIGMTIVCPHCSCETKLTTGSEAGQSSKIQLDQGVNDAGVGHDVLLGKWENEPMSEKQKAMFVLYGIGIKGGLTKGEASQLINAAKQSGITPTEENKKKAERLFEVIDLSQKGENILKIIQFIQDENMTIKQLKQLKTALREATKELREIIDNRIYQQQQKEDELREIGELD